MNGLIINIDWVYFLGIMGSIIFIAWYSSARFTALETSMQWVKKILNELKVASDNKNTPAFISKSPINLTAIGEKWLIESGIKEYLDLNKEIIMTKCKEKEDTNPYEVQEHVFKLFDTLELEPDFENKLKKFAYEQGTTMNIMRRVAAIYFRNLCLKKFEMDMEDIDKHNSEKPKPNIQMNQSDTSAQQE